MEEKDLNEKIEKLREKLLAVKRADISEEQAVKISQKLDELIFDVMKEEK